MGIAKKQARQEINGLLNDYNHPIKKYKARKNPKKFNKKTRLEKYALKIEKNLPKSEKWFREKWIELFKNDLEINTDHYNSPFGKYIPDVVNHVYKYIIEIDGSIHNSVKVKYHNELKDFFYKKSGYTVHRIVAYNNEQFNEVYEIISKLRTRRY